MNLDEFESTPAGQTGTPLTNGTIDNTVNDNTNGDDPNDVFERPETNPVTLPVPGVIPPVPVPPPVTDTDYVTVLTSDSGTINKVYDLNEDGTVIKRDNFTTFYKGTAIKIHVSSTPAFEYVMNEMAEAPNKSIVLGFHPGIPANVKYVIDSTDNIKKRGLNPINNMPGFYYDETGTGYVTTRTKKIMAQSSYILIDHDDKHPDKPDQSYADWENDMDRIMPGFKNAEKLFKPSNSSRATGGQISKWHVFVKVKDTRNVSSLGHRIQSTAHSLGLGFDKVTKDGKHLPRTITDTAVYSPERITFDGRPTIYNSTGHDVSHIKLAPANIQILPGDGNKRPIDTSRVKMQPDDKDKFKTKYSKTVDAAGKSINVKTTNYIHDNDTVMQLDTPIVIKGRPEPVTFQELIDNPGLYQEYGDETGKIRAQIPGEIRHSTSWNGILRAGDDGMPLIIDNGTDIKYKLSEAIVVNLEFGQPASVVPVVQTASDAAEQLHLIDRFYFIKTRNRFYEKKTRSTMSKDAFNQVEFGEEIEGTIRTAAKTFKYRNGICVDGITWQPSAYGEQSEALVKVEQNVLINEFFLPHHVIRDSDDSKVTLFIEHLKYLLPDDAERNTYLDHQAFTMQFPDIKINWQVMFLGKTRIGKDFSLKPLAWYFGSMYQEIDPDDDEANKWGDIKAKKKVLTYQEIFRPKDRGFYNQLKPIAAGTAGGMINLNMKGGGQLTQYNLFSVYCMSNHTDAIHLPEDDQRWLVLDAFNVVEREAEYYTILFNWFENGGCEAVSAWLLSRDLTQFTPGKLPLHTTGKTSLINESHSSIYNKLEKMIMHEEGVFNPAVTVFTLEMVIECLESLKNKRVNKNILVTELKSLGIEKLENRGEKTINGERKKVLLYRKKSPFIDGIPDMTPTKLYSEYLKSMRELDIMINGNNALNTPQEVNVIVDGQTFTTTFLKKRCGWSAAAIAALPCDK